MNSISPKPTFSQAMSPKLTFLSDGQRLLARKLRSDFRQFPSTFSHHRSADLLQAPGWVS